MSVEDIFYEINKLIAKKVPVNVDVLCIDGTKYEANANKNTFIWRANTTRNRMKRWKKTLQCIHKINEFFKRNNISVRYSQLKDPSIELMLGSIEDKETVLKDVLTPIKDNRINILLKFCQIV